MKMLKTMLFVGIVLVAVLLIISFFLPSQVRVERTGVVHAPKEAVYAMVNNLTRWPSWSPWLRYDPNAKLIYHGPTSGKGASYSWSSEDSRLGTGKVEIVETITFRKVVTTVQFGDMDASYSDMHFSSDDHTTTTVRWGMDVDFGINPISRWFGLFFEGMIGPDFEQGIANMDSIMRSTAKRMSAIRQEQYAGGPVLQVRSSTSTETIGAALADAYGKIMQYAAAKHLDPTGAPFAQYPDWTDARTTVVASIPFSALDPGAGDVIGSTMPPCTVLVIDYYGPYEYACLAYAALDAHIKNTGVAYSGTSWETYVTDPASEKDPSKWLTRVYYRLQ